MSEDDALPACPDCGGALRFDQLMVGDTVGRLTLRGWDVCLGCGKGWHAGRRAVVHERWRVADSGLSVETGHVRIRFDGDPTTKARLAVRIATLPALEELRDLVEALIADPDGFPGWPEKAVDLLERSRAAVPALGPEVVGPEDEAAPEVAEAPEPTARPKRARRRKAQAQADLFADGAEG